MKDDIVIVGADTSADKKIYRYKAETPKRIFLWRFGINAEGQRQSAETIAAAEAEVSAIARQAVNSQTAQDQAMLRSQRAQACSTTDIAAGAVGSNAV